MFNEILTEADACFEEPDNWTLVTSKKSKKANKRKNRNVKKRQDFD